MKPLYLLGLINVRRAYFRGGSLYSYCDEAANVVAAVVSDETNFRFAVLARITSISLLFRGNSARTFSPVNFGPTLDRYDLCQTKRLFRFAVLSPEHFRFRYPGFRPGAQKFFELINMHHSSN